MSPGDNLVVIHITDRRLGNRDSQLVLACLAGERAAFEALYGAHAARAKAYFMRSGFALSDADDLLQETFLRVHKSLGTFNAERGSFSSWLAAIARNVARRSWARRSDPENFDPEIAEEVLADTDNPRETPELREQLAMLRDCVAELPRELSSVVNLRYVRGRTTRGVAAITGLPEATARLRLRQATEALERCLRRKGVVDV